MTNEPLRIVPPPTIPVQVADDIAKVVMELAGAVEAGRLVSLICVAIDVDGRWVEYLTHQDVLKTIGALEAAKALLIRKIP